MDNNFMMIRMADLRTLVREIAEEVVAAMGRADDRPAASETEEWMTPKQVAHRLGCSSQTLWRWEKEGYLAQRCRYRAEDVERVAKAEGSRDEKIHARYLELMKTGLNRASALRVLRAEFPFDSRATVYAILARMGDPYRKPAGASGK